MALMAPALAEAAGAKPRAHSPGATPVAVTKSLAQLSKSELKAKLASVRVAKIAPLFETPEGDEIPEMTGDGTSGGFDLVYRGVRASAYDDADGKDEVAVWVALVRPTATGYTKSVHKVAAPTALSAGRPGSDAGAATVFHGDRGPALLLGAVIEDDDGNSAQRIAELDVLLEQAIAAATLLRDDNDDPIDVLHGMIELGGVMLGADPGRPHLGIRPIRTTDWDRLWDVDPTREGGRPKSVSAATSKAATAPSMPLLVYKLSLGGQVGAGRYSLRFDVPAKPGRKPRRAVKVDLQKLLVITPPAELKAGNDKTYFARVCMVQSGFAGLNIDQPAPQSCITKQLSWAHAAANWESLKVYRRMRQGETRITVLSWWKWDSGSEYKFLDLDAGNDGFATITRNVGATPGSSLVTTIGDGEGGASYSGHCYACGFPSGAAIGTLSARVDH